MRRAADFPPSCVLLGCLLGSSLLSSQKQWRLSILALLPRQEKYRFRFFFIFHFFPAEHSFALHAQSPAELSLIPALLPRSLTSHSGHSAPHPPFPSSRFLHSPKNPLARTLSSDFQLHGYTALSMPALTLFPLLSSSNTNVLEPARRLLSEKGVWELPDARMTSCLFLGPVMCLFRFTILLLSLKDPPNAFSACAQTSAMPPPPPPPFLMRRITPGLWTAHPYLTPFFRH